MLHLIKKRKCQRCVAKSETWRARTHSSRTGVPTRSTTLIQNVEIEKILFSNTSPVSTQAGFYLLPTETPTQQSKNSIYIFNTLTRIIIYLSRKYRALFLIKMSDFDTSNFTNIESLLSRVRAANKFSSPKIINSIILTKRATVDGKSNN